MALTRVKYIGPYHFRVLRPSDFEREGQPHGVEVQWERDGNHTLELPGPVAKMLFKKFPEEFELGDEPEASAAVPTDESDTLPATSDPTPAG